MSQKVYYFTLLFAGLSTQDSNTVTQMCNIEVLWPKYVWLEAFYSYFSMTTETQRPSVWWSVAELKNKMNLNLSLFLKDSSTLHLTLDRKCLGMSGSPCRCCLCETPYELCSCLSPSTSQCTEHGSSSALEESLQSGCWYKSFPYNRKGKHNFPGHGVQHISCMSQF